MIVGINSCAHCNGALKVTDTTRDHANVRVVRTRQCQKCGRTTHTFEYGASVVMQQLILLIQAGSAAKEFLEKVNPKEGG